MSKRGKREHFVKLESRILESEPWRNLNVYEMIVYIYIKKNYKGKDNGKILLRYSELKGIMSRPTISKALKGLKKKGWIENTRVGGLYRYSCHYRLTGRYEPILGE